MTGAELRDWQAEHAADYDRMTGAELRDWQAEHAADYDRMAGLVAALAIAFGALSGLAVYLAITT